MLKINNKQVVGDMFAYDGCHKIYIIEDDIDLEEAKSLGYEIYTIVVLKEKWKESCSLRFIRNWKLDKRYVEQFEKATFRYV